MLLRCIFGLEKHKHRCLSLFLSEPGSENISLIGVFTHSVILNQREKHRSGLAQTQGNMIIQSLFIRFSPGAKYRLFCTSSYSHVPFDLWATVLFLLLHQHKEGVQEQLQRWWRGCEQLRDYGRQTVCRMFSLSLSLFQTHHLPTEGRKMTPIHLCSTKTSVTGWADLNARLSAN